MMSSDRSLPRLAECFLCKAWQLEKDLIPIEIPDQAMTYIQKLACKKCLDNITGDREGQDHKEDH
jgi:hypothetical protein